MRKETPPSAASAAARFRSQIVRARGALAAQGPASRWALALGALAILVLCGYLAAPVPSGSGSVLLRGGQGEKFSIGEVIRISHALDLQRIDYRVDDQHRIEVPADRLEEAKAVLAKLDIGRRSIEELDQAAQASSPLDGPDDKALRQHKGQEQILAAMIREFDDIVSAYVSINRPRLRVGFRPGVGPGAVPRTTAFVWLETDGGRAISHKTVQSIQNLLIGKEPDLKPDAVTVFDQKGRHYLVAGDPRSSTLSATRAREEDLAQRILEEIDWIDGVRVTVQLVPDSSMAPSAPAPPAPGASPSPAGTAQAPPLPSSRAPDASISVNAPLELGPSPSPEPAASVPDLQLGYGPGPGPDPATGLTSSPPVIPASSLPEPPGLRREVARVWVRVPHSYYNTKAAPDRDPSPDRLQEIVRRTESLIQVAVAHVVPPELTPRGEPLDVKIDTIHYREPDRMPLGSQVGQDARRPLSWWLPAGVAAGGLIGFGSVLVVRLLAARVPAARQRRVAAPHSARYRGDRASDAGASPGPGPAERVRELVRRNPEAAASVLHRWIGQGEAIR